LKQTCFASAAFPWKKGKTQRERPNKALSIARGVDL
jgi:hypothetical protein